MAVVGPSGSGKTSLLMMIGGLETPSSGSIRIHDTDISTLSEDGRADFRRQHIGIVFQSFHLAPAMTAVENVMLPLLLSNAPDPTARAMQSLESVGLGHRARHYPAHLSGGENQRCALARALVMQPSVLLADEPTGNLDEDNSNVITDLLFALARENNAAVLLVTHDTQLAKKCDGTLTMRDGKIS
ncbi:MAG: ABC transporter ATP-binding protein [Actinomycetia bacterium]|nr:ABC transporter ATP-binding protein [Actinomycetes bacterium]